MSYKCNFKQGDLLKEDYATFIINASNTKLILGSGVSISFKRHCGNKLQNEMNQKLQQIGILKKGDVVATSARDMKNFIYVLHVAVIDYNQGIAKNTKLPVLQDIQNALENIEKYIKWYIENQQNVNVKLVLPLIGCGTGGLNKEDVIKLYKDFFCKKVSLTCEVVIYGHTTKDYKTILEIMH